MSGGRDFKKLKGLRNIALRGYEPRGGRNLLAGKRGRRKSKTQHRDEAAAISSDTMMTKLVSCRHGHQNELRVTIAESAGPFSCSKCGEKAR